MEELTEKRVWQRVRGEGQLDRVRICLADQGPLLTAYRSFSRRGGPWRRLYEQKTEQVACFRGLIRVLTGQGSSILLCTSSYPTILRVRKRWLRLWA